LKSHFEEESETYLTIKKSFGIQIRLLLVTLNAPSSWCRRAEGSKREVKSEQGAEPNAPQDVSHHSRIRSRVSSRFVGVRAAAETMNMFLLYF